MIRVMTYNIRGGLGMDGQRSIARIAEVVAAHSPDIVCFQELHQRTFRVGWHDQARQLQGLLGMPVVFQRNFNLIFGGEGVGIGSRFPILSVNHHFLPSVRERRGVLHVQVQTPEFPISVFCTHWGLKPDERNRQAQATADIVKNASAPVILCGDLNDRPDAASLQTLLSATSLQDTTNSREPTYPSDTRTAKIDYILCSPELRIETASVIASLASDHRPLLAEICPAVPF